MESPLVAQVRLADALVLERDTADLDEVRARGDVQRDVCVLLDDEHGQASRLVQLPHEPEELAYDQRREPERGLVEEEQARPRHQRTLERKHLLLAARERSRLLVTALLE